MISKNLNFLIKPVGKIFKDIINLSNILNISSEIVRETSFNFTEFSHYFIEPQWLEWFIGPLRK